LQRLPWGSPPLRSGSFLIPPKADQDRHPFPAPRNTNGHHDAPRRAKMTERMGQQIIVENRPGASGMLGPRARRARGARRLHPPPRVQGGNLTVLPHYEQEHQLDPLKDFAPIAVSTTNYLGIVANPECRSRRSRK